MAVTDMLYSLANDAAVRFSVGSSFLRIVFLIWALYYAIGHLLFHLYLGDNYYGRARGYITPEQRRRGEDIRLFALRHETLQKAFLQHPERFPKGGPKTWKVQRIVYLNPSNETRKIIHKKNA